MTLLHADRLQPNRSSAGQALSRQADGSNRARRGGAGTNWHA